MERFTKMVIVTGGAKPTFDEKTVEVQVYRLVIVDGAVGRLVQREHPFNPP
jgi:hypothetical protein